MSLGTFVLVAVAVFFSVGCSSERDSGRRQTADRQQDEQEIRKLIDSFSIAFNNKDAQLLSELWHSDGDARPGGRLISGRLAIQERYVPQLFSGLPGGTTHSHPGSITIRFIRPDVVIADGEYLLSAARDQAGKELPSVRGAWTVVLTKEGDDWRFGALRTGPSSGN